MIFHEEYGRLISKPTLNIAQKRTNTRILSSILPPLLLIAFIKDFFLDYSNYTIEECAIFAMIILFFFLMLETAFILIYKANNTILELYERGFIERYYSSGKLRGHHIVKYMVEGDELVGMDNEGESISITRRGHRDYQQEIFDEMVEDIHSFQHGNSNLPECHEYDGEENMVEGADKIVDFYYSKMKNLLLIIICWSLFLSISATAWIFIEPSIGYYLLIIAIMVSGLFSSYHLKLASYDKPDRYVLKNDVLIHQPCFRNSMITESVNLKEVRKTIMQNSIITRNIQLETSNDKNAIIVLCNWEIGWKHKKKWEQFFEEIRKRIPSDVEVVVN